MNASRTSAPTSNAAGPMAGPSHAAMPAGSHAMAATVFSITPAAKPRQPACAAPIVVPAALATVQPQPAEPARYDALLAGRWGDGL